MSRNSVRILSITAGLLVAAAIMVPATARAQVCGPLDNGHIADVSYEGTVAVWQPIIEYDRLVLTVTAPCEKIVREFKAGDPVMFDLRDVSREADGQYTWELRAVPVIDPKVRAALTASRGSGEEDALWWSLWQKGLIYGGPSVESGGFLVDRGEIVKPGVEEKSARVAAKDSGPGSATLAGAVATGASASGTATGGSDGNVLSTKDTVLTNADGVIRNSLCVGFDCPNSNTYSDSTVLLTENNTRIKFDDTSTVTGFPKEDWELQANSSLSGGGSFFAINDCGNSSGGGCADDPVFIVEGGAPANSIRVDNGGRVGLGTANPVVELHVVDGDTPTLRLAQDGSSGFAPQTWDVAGNETSFFVRDATNGSTLPFRIRPGAPSSSIDIAANGNVGIGTGSPSSKLHIRGVDSGSGNALKLNFENTGTGTTWFFQNDQDNTFKISKSGSGGFRGDHRPAAGRQRCDAPGRRQRAGDQRDLQLVAGAEGDDSVPGPPRCPGAPLPAPDHGVEVQGGSQGDSPHRSDGRRLPLRVPGRFQRQDDLRHRRVGHHHGGDPGVGPAARRAREAECGARGQAEGDGRVQDLGRLKSLRFVGKGRGVRVPPLVLVLASKAAGRR